MAVLVTLDALRDVLGTSVDPERGQLAVDTANLVVPAWTGAGPAPATNLLTDQQATLEGGVGGWQPVGTGTQASDMSTADQGAASLTLTRGGAGSGQVTITTTPTPVVPAVPGAQYTAMVSARSPGHRTASLVLQWGDAATGAVVGTVTVATAPITDDLWHRLRGVAVAPAGAGRVRPQVTLGSWPPGEILGIDRVGIFAGDVAAWAAPPAPSPASRQAALEVAHHFYRNQAEPGAFVVAGGFAAPEAALPGDVARRVRDLLDVDTTDWGVA